MKVTCAGKCDGMTGRQGQIAMDGSPISAADVARMEAEEALHAEWARKAVRVVAASAEDAKDCRMLLAILGLDGDPLRQAVPRHRSAPAGPATGKVSPRRS